VTAAITPITIPTPPKEPTAVAAFGLKVTKVYGQRSGVGNSVREGDTVQLYWSLNEVSNATKDLAWLRSNLPKDRAWWILRYIPATAAYGDGYRVATMAGVIEMTASGPRPSMLRASAEHLARRDFDPATTPIEDEGGVVLDLVTRGDGFTSSFDSAATGPAPSLLHGG
jgi:hypothetical protein